jgi:hypothetical protein
MKIFLRIIKWIGIVVIVLVLGILISGVILYNRKYDAPYPDMHASSDSAIIVHGKHLVMSTAHCIECHFKPGDSALIVTGEDAPLAGGGFPFEFPGGVFYSKNISSDKESGIGNLTDGEIARALRYGIKHDGSVLIPVMEYQHMCDEDLVAILSYLRTSEPVSHKVPENDYNLLGKALFAFFLRPPVLHQDPPLMVMPDTTIEYGRYLAGDVSNCRSCHTLRDMNTGKYIGKDLAGGPVMGGDSKTGKILVAPNITPDPETGVLRNWTFEQFKTRFRMGKAIPESIMPWGQFKHMTDLELLAIWKYLHSVKPVKQDNGPYLQISKK